MGTQGRESEEEQTKTQSVSQRTGRTGITATSGTKTGKGTGNTRRERCPTKPSNLTQRIQKTPMDTSTRLTTTSRVTSNGLQVQRLGEERAIHTSCHQCSKHVLATIPVSKQHRPTRTQTDHRVRGLTTEVKKRRTPRGGGGIFTGTPG
jgi:hypothetical protein